MLVRRARVEPEHGVIEVQRFQLDLAALPEVPLDGRIDLAMIVEVLVARGARGQRLRRQERHVRLHSD